MMYQCMKTRQALSHYPRLLHRAASNDSNIPHYRDRAEHFNNPYKEFFQHGKKPRTFRERFIESKKNEPKPRIGIGDHPGNFLSLKRGVGSRRNSFYNDNKRVTFTELGVMPELAQQIAELGAVYPTHHQSDVIPVLLENKNCVFISPTGSGKSYTYLLPTVQLLLESKKQGFITKSQAPRIIIMLPTKFLALQIGLVAKHLTQNFELRTVCLSELRGGAQTRELQGPPIDILIGTYENITSWITSGTLSTSDLQHLVIDEVDHFMDYRNVVSNDAFLKEFVDQEEGRTKCQMILAGAILQPTGFRRLGEAVPDIEQYLNPKSHMPLDHVEQKFCFVNNKNKVNHVIGLMKGHVEGRSMQLQRPLIFCNFNNTAYWLHKHLISNGINNIFMGRDLTSSAKTRLIQSEIPNTDFPIVTTDSFGYGLDFRDIGLVLNYEFPFTYEDYIRRIGRTGRMSSNAHQCEAISYVSYNRDKALFNIIKNSTRSRECKAYSLLSTNKFGWIRK